jgi:hypothetical protein
VRIPIPKTPVIPEVAVTTRIVAAMSRRAAAIALPCLVVLSGCNSLDALTPPENVGDGSYQSSPVNQADLDTMSAQAPIMRNGPIPGRDVPGEDVPVERSAALSSPLSSGPSWSSETGEPMRSASASTVTGSTAYARGDESYRNPAGSLEAQASALATDPPPQVEASERAVGFPADGNEVRETQAAARAEVSPPLSDTQAETSAALPADETASGAEATDDVPAQAASVAPSVKAGPSITSGTFGTIRFLPIIGAPVDAIRPLSEQLGADARARGLTIKTAVDPSSQHILKGYFSAFKDGRKTTIVYVWDVLDQAGNRLHRIQGQDSVDTKNADLWSGVPPQTMRDIASKSVSQYLEWRDQTAG